MPNSCDSETRCRMSITRGVQHQVRHHNRGARKGCWMRVQELYIEATSSPCFPRLALCHLSVQTSSPFHPAKHTLGLVGCPSLSYSPASTALERGEGAGQGGVRPLCVQWQHRSWGRTPQDTDTYMEGSIQDSSSPVRLS